jgi:hypothetical protein
MLLYEYRVSKVFGLLTTIVDRVGFSADLDPDPDAYPVLDTGLTLPSQKLNFP